MSEANIRFESDDFADTMRSLHKGTPLQNRIAWVATNGMGFGRHRASLLENPQDILNHSLFTAESQIALLGSLDFGDLPQEVEYHRIRTEEEKS